jgi:amino acid transporter
VKDTRRAEIVWLVVIAILVAAGATPLLDFLASHRIGGTIVTLGLVAATAVMIRRAYLPDAPNVRADVTRACTYCAAAVLAFVTVEWNPHWGIRSCIAAAEVAILFDVVSIAARRSPLRDTGESA